MLSGLCHESDRGIIINRLFRSEMREDRDLNKEVTMAKVKLDISRCKGCFLCASVCPKGVLTPSSELGDKGFGIVHLDETKECIGCGACYKMCPDYCIEIID